jgi:allantoicase
MTDFTKWVDLASERVGGRVLAANDEFFAPKESLLHAAAPVWKEGVYTDRGKWMDGWESRRRREPGYDWCIIRLGVPGVIRGVVVDTAFFRGNYPEQCSLEVCDLPGQPDVGQLLSDDTVWREIVGRSDLQGNSPNELVVDGAPRATHIRFNIFPDGGVARLRVYGDVAPAWDRLDFAGGPVDLAAVEHGGRVVDCSDMFFGERHNLIMPGRAKNMGDGWETRRRRGPGNDWAIVALGAPGTIDRVEVDTSHFKGNAPGSCTLEACAADGDDLTNAQWKPLLADSKLQPDTRHFFDDQLRACGATTHVRLSIFPDGGVARLRLWGKSSRAMGLHGGLAGFNAIEANAARDALTACCGCTSWAGAVCDARPYADVASLMKYADSTWRERDRDGWLEAFAAHPKIGAKKVTDDRFGAWSKQEQSGVAAAADTTLAELAAINERYFDKFGYIFIVCATGKSAAEMLDLATARIGNDADQEIAIAAEEQRKITRIRLAKMLSDAKGS